MYSILTEEEKKEFTDEIETTITMRGQSVSLDKVNNYFDIVIKDKLDSSVKFSTFTGSYYTDRDQLIISKIRLMKDELIDESPGLQKIIGKEAIKQFICRANESNCKRLVVYTANTILVEELFKLKFRLVQLISQNYEVRAEIDV